MLRRHLVRLSAALMAVVLFSACDSDALGPEDVVVAPASHSEGGIVVGESGPSFTLSLPATLVEGQRLSRTVNFGAYEEQVSSATVNYGDGSGIKNLSIQRTCPFALCEGSSWSYSTSLSHVYTAPGTYTVTVKATDASGTRTRTASITITEDLNIYIEGFTITEPVVQGTPMTVSFSARGPGEDLFATTIKYGGNLIQTGFIEPGGTRERSYTWPQPGTYTLTIIVNNETHADTLTHAVVVEPAPITFSSVEVGSAFEGDTVAFGFEVEALPGSSPTTVTLSWGDGTPAETFPLSSSGVVSRKHVWAETGVYTVEAAVTNGVTTGTLTREVVVRRDPPAIADFALTDVLYVGGPKGQLSFRATDPAEGSTLSYRVRIRVGEIEEATDSRSTQRDALVELPLQADGDSPRGTYELSVILESLKNGVLETDSVAGTLEVKDPIVCEAGSYWSGGACLPAPAGSYVATSGATAATSCEVGRYQDQEGQTSCKDAPAGSFVNVTGATQATPCEPGTVQDQTGQVSCYDAAPGTIAPEAGLAASVPCAAGTFQPAPGQVSCIDAEPGHYVAGTGATDDVPCELGTFAAEPGQAACDPAPAGRYVDVAGATSATLCSPGYYQDQEGQRYCYEAPAGSFAAYPGTVSPELCPAGTYQPEAGQMVCLFAQPGSYATGPGATSTELCQPGSFAAEEAQAACDPAPAGSFVAEAGATGIEPCAPGTFSALPGQSSCTQAPAGSYVGFAGATAATPCEPGSYQGATGATSCLDAPAGSFVAGSGATAATLCPVGTYQPESGQLSCLAAPVDSYVDVTGALQPTACPTGTGTLAEGSTSADDCLPLGDVAVASIQEGLDAGTLTPARSGPQGTKAVTEWIDTIERGTDFFEAGQKQAGCAQLRNAYRRADGKGGPPDVVSGPARADIAALLLRILEEEGC